MSGKSVFSINNHMPLLGYRNNRILIISIQYPTIRFDLIDKVKMSIYRLSMTSLYDSVPIASLIPMLRLLSSKAHGRKDFGPCHVGIYYIACVGYSQMSTHVAGFRSFFRVFATFCIA